ncbi:MAG TPA: trigger factor [Vicinamibacterales bacterium]|nr:trigger factor [Vicinamibacterales bacterium]
MKTELTDVTETQKTISIEIPTDVVDAEFDRVARGYTKQARLPGFRPGKVPQTLIKQRFREQILHDVMHGLIPRAVEEALQTRGIEPVDTPDVREVDLAEGRPLKFTAAFETVPAFDPGDLSSITLRQPSAQVSDEDVDDMLRRLRERAAKYETVDGRAIADDDAVVLDIDRTDAAGQVDHRDGVTVQLGASGNPPGFDAQLVGLNEGDSKTFAIQFPEDHSVPELANTQQTYSVTVKGVRRRVLPDLDDEFAKDIGPFDSLSALRDHVRHDLEAEAQDNARRQVRSELFRQLSQRIPFELPTSLVDREMDRRVEEFARQLASQNVDPRQAGIDWGQFREAQREPAWNAVASALALDEIARREQITVMPEDVDKEIERFAVRAGRTPAALRAQLEKEGGISRLYAGLRREKAVDLALSRAKMAP